MFNCPQDLRRVLASNWTPALPSRFNYWIRILTEFVSVQIAVQLIGAASGILLVRILDQSEYAYFTIASSMQATINILTDAGISIGLSSIGGKIWQNPYRFGQLINTAMQLRRYLTAIIMTIVTPIFVWLLIRNGTSPVYAVLLTVIVLIGLSYQLSAGVLMIVLRLHSQINRLQKLDLIVALSRVAFLGIAFFIFLDAAIAIMATAVAMGIQCFLLSRWAFESIDANAPTHNEDRRTILKLVRSQLPLGIFYCLQGQLTIWLVSFFGSVHNIAEVGALARIGIIFGVITAIMSNIVMPSFARCQSYKLLVRRYWQIISANCLFGLILISLAILSPNHFLWILGGKYAHLQNELVLMVAGMVFSSISGIMWFINASKAWIEYSWLYIPITILTQIFLLIILNVNTVRGVLLLSLLSLIPSILLSAALTCRGFHKLKLSLAE